jgi:hypothetical protein
MPLLSGYKLGSSFTEYISHLHNHPVLADEDALYAIVITGE